ncbi:hypothetical protein K1719_010658 [Acacia pycnantha]|nr:hypothetical protein K1719_010658 [Acacia pycnantha]
MKDTYDRWLGLNNINSGQNIEEAKPLSCEMKNWLGEITLNVVFRMVVGKRFAETQGKDTIQKTLRDWFDLSGSFVISDALPYLRWLDLGGQERAMRKTAKDLDQFIQFWLDEHRHNRDDAGSREAKPKHGDFMDVLVSSVDEAEMIDGHDADSTIKATSLALILAATDTTTVTLTWALSLLMNNPEVLKKAVHELDSQVGKERIVVESDLKNLHYLQAIIKEAMRLYPAAPLSVIHESMEDCTVAGYHIPSGTRLLTNLSKIHRDPRVYEDPLEFKPERFLTTHKNIDLRGQHFELIPFGAGRRICPGISFALQITQLTLASLLHGFDVSTVDNQAVDMREQEEEETVGNGTNYQNSSDDDGDRDSDGGEASVAAHPSLHDRSMFDLLPLPDFLLHSRPSPKFLGRINFLLKKAINDKGGMVGGASQGEEGFTASKVHTLLFLSNSLCLLQAIAVILCISESWSVLILAPSSLRLQWASMTRKFLSISAPTLRQGSLASGKPSAVESNNHRGQGFSDVENGTKSGSRVLRGISIETIAATRIQTAYRAYKVCKVEIIAE